MDVQARDIILMKGKVPDTYLFYLVDFYDPDAQYFSAYRIHTSSIMYRARDFRIHKKYMKSDLFPNKGGWVNLFTGRASMDKKHIVEVVSRLPQQDYAELLAKYIVIATGGWYKDGETYKVGGDDVPLSGIVSNFSAVAAMKKIDMSKLDKDDDTPKVAKPGGITPKKKQERVRPGAAFGPKKKEKHVLTYRKPTGGIGDPNDKDAPRITMPKDEIHIGFDYRDPPIPERQPEKTLTTAVPTLDVIGTPNLKETDPMSPAPEIKPDSFAQPKYEQRDYTKLDMAVVKRRYMACKTRKDRLEELFKMLEDAQGCIPVGDVYRYLFVDYKGNSKMRKPNIKAIMVSLGELESLADSTSVDEVMDMAFYRYGSNGEISELSSKNQYYDLIAKCRAICNGKDY